MEGLYSSGVDYNGREIKELMEKRNRIWISRMILPRGKEVSFSSPPDDDAIRKNNGKAGCLARKSGEGSHVNRTDI